MSKKAKFLEKNKNILEKKEHPCLKHNYRYTGYDDECYCKDCKHYFNATAYI